MSFDIASFAYDQPYENVHKNVFFFFFDFIYLFMRDNEREAGRDMGRGRSRLHAGSLMWDLILGPWDHALSQRQMLNC